MTAAGIHVDLLLNLQWLCLKFPWYHEVWRCSLLQYLTSEQPNPEQEVRIKWQRDVQSVSERSKKSSMGIQYRALASDLT